MTKHTAVDIVSALGVIAGLLFVGLEIRQATVSTRAATVLQLKQSWVQLNLTLASSPELAEAMGVVTRQGYDEADSDSRDRYAAFYRALFYSMSNAYSQYLLGTLQEEEWLPHLRDAASLSTQPNTWRIWDDWDHIYNDRFRVLMDSLRTANFR